MPCVTPNYSVTRPCANVGYSSEGLLILPAQQWQDYLADAREAYLGHFTDLKQRVEAIQE
jgi:hypothetical protein